MTRLWIASGAREDFLKFRRYAIERYLEQGGKAHRPHFSSADLDWATLQRKLSEPSGYFFSQNLVSNELQYLSAIPQLRALPNGLAYLGVGPEPMLSYLSAVESPLSLVVDIRRDNARLHFLYRALFLIAKTRLEWLALLLGRALPAYPASLDNAPVSSLLESVLALPKSESAFGDTHHCVENALRQMPSHLLPFDRWRIQQIHHTFFRHGLELTFQLGGPNLRRYPTLGRLLAEQDKTEGAQGFLASEEAFLRIARMEQEGRVVPIVGNLAGAVLDGIAEELQKKGLRLGALYISNVEQYLFEAGQWQGFVAKLRTLPFHPDALVIRSYFENQFGALPDPPSSLISQLKRSAEIAARTALASGPLPEHCMRTTVHRVSRFFEKTRTNTYRNYRELVSDRELVC